MDFLHSYWRMSYIETPKIDKEPQNPFVEIPNVSPGHEKSVHLLYRGQHTYIVMNKYPYNAGHLLAIPYREVSTLGALSGEERADLMEAIVKGQDILTKAITPDGFNVGFNFGSAAGAGAWPRCGNCQE